MDTKYDTSDAAGQNFADDLKSGSKQASERVMQDGKAKAEQVAARTAEQLEDIADATAAGAEEVGARGHTNLSHYMTDIAENIGELAHGLKGKSADDLVHDASSLARRNPAIFLLGSVAIGFGLARFAKASQPAKETPDSESGDIPTTDTTIARKNYLGADLVGSETSFTRPSFEPTGSIDEPLYP
jgi:hypothetical protein